LKTLADYTHGNKRLQMGYSFELLADEFSVAHIKNTVNNLEAVIGEGWPCWAVSNHDVTRVVSRWGNGEHNQQFAKMTLALAASLRGTLCVYQGEELGFTEAEIGQHDLQDPFGIQFWPEFKGRDGCRTPMAWNDSAPHAGFSDKLSWLPIASEHIKNNVAKQSAEPNSVLNFYKEFLSWRKGQTALLQGDVKFLDAPDNLLVIQRSSNNSDLIACFNLSAKPINYNCEDLVRFKRSGSYAFDLDIDGNDMHFGAYGFGYLIA